MEEQTETTEKVDIWDLDLDEIDYFEEQTDVDFEKMLKSRNAGEELNLGIRYSKLAKVMLTIALRRRDGLDWPEAEREAGRTKATMINSILGTIDSPPPVPAAAAGS